MLVFPLRLGAPPLTLGAPPRGTLAPPPGLPWLLGGEKNLVTSSETSGSSWLEFNMFMDCSISFKRNNMINQSTAFMFDHDIMSSYPPHLRITGVDDFRKENNDQKRKNHHKNLRERTRVKVETSNRCVAVTGPDWYSSDPPSGSWGNRTSPRFPAGWSMNVDRRISSEEGTAVESPLMSWCSWPHEPCTSDTEPGRLHDTVN